jgi:hypothetical protein
VNLFDGGDGYRPDFRVLQAADGFLYATTPQGGLLDFQAERCSASARAAPCVFCTPSQSPATEVLAPIPS